MRVWVTRDETAGGPLSTALRDAGLSVLLDPVVERRILDDASHVIHSLGPGDWLVLTSVFAIDAVAGVPSRVPRLAVVGDSSRDAALARGMRVELVARGGTGQALFAELRELVHRGTVCYPRSSLAVPPDPWPGVSVLSPVLYETIPRAFDPTTVERADVVAITSPSAVDALGAVDLPFASIGPTTSAALRARGIEPWVEADEPSFESLAAAIANRSADTEIATSPQRQITSGKGFMMRSRLTEHGDRRVWHIGGHEVTFLHIDNRFGFDCWWCDDRGDHQLNVSIENTFVFVDCETEHTCTPERIETIAPVLSILHRPVASLTAFANGRLEIDFVDTAQIRVSKDLQYESWEANGKGDLQDLVLRCTPHESPPWIDSSSTYYSDDDHLNTGDSFRPGA